MAMIDFNCQFLYIYILYNRSVRSVCQLLEGYHGCSTHIWKGYLGGGLKWNGLETVGGANRKGCFAGGLKRKVCLAGALKTKWIEGVGGLKRMDCQDGGLKSNGQEAFDDLKRKDFFFK